MEQLGVRLSPAVLAYCDELKPQLGVSATADVMREIVSQLQSWFDLPGFMAESPGKGNGRPAPEHHRICRRRSRGGTRRCGTMQPSAGAAGKPAARARTLSRQTLATAVGGVFLEPRARSRPRCSPG